MADPAFTAVKRHLYRQSLVIFGSATLAVLLGIAVVMAVLEVLAHERANLHADFTATMAYIHEQEQFLRKLQAQNEQTQFFSSPLANTAPVIPLSLVKTQDDPVWQSMYPAFSRYLAQYYTLFWSFSDFPAAHLLVLEHSDALRLTVPALDPPMLSQQVGNQAETMDEALLEQAVAAAQRYFSAEKKDVLPKDQPIWLPLPGQEQRMLALLPAGLADPHNSMPRLWLAMVLNHRRLQANDASMLEQHRFALHTADGRQVLGADAAFLEEEGFSFNTQGLTLCFEQAQWQGCYRISYARFIGANLWLLLLLIPLLVLGVLGALAYLRWFGRHVIDPAQHTQQALVQAKNAAQAADHAKTVFLATMSHEIRTPLYALLGSLELLALTPLQMQQQRYLARIQGAAQLLMQQINDVLDINRIEAGQMSLQPVVFSPEKWLHDTLAIYQDPARQKNIALLCHCDPQLPAQLLGDAARLRQILCNLLSNAIKFTDNNGQIVVRLSQQSRHQKQCDLVLQVSDSGKGLAPEHLPQLFTPFYLPEKGGLAQGTGLGLSICQRLAQLMGSQIEVSSTLGKGSQFSLHLNLPMAEDNLEAIPSAKPTWQQHKLHALIAEDNPFNQATLKDQLQQLGCRVTVAANGEQALAQWPRARCDVLLVDVNMPGLNGCELVRCLRAQGANQPMIGISANALAGEPQRCLDSGMNGWLSKPIALEQLSRLLGELCPHACVTPSPSTDQADDFSTQHHHLFVQTMNEDLQQLRHSLSHADTARLVEKIHRMRGALAVIGQHELLDYFGQLQDELLEHGLDQAKHALHRLCVRLQTWLDDISENPSVSIAN